MAAAVVLALLVAGGTAGQADRGAVVAPPGLTFDPSTAPDSDAKGEPIIVFPGAVGHAPRRGWLDPSPAALLEWPAYVLSGLHREQEAQIRASGAESMFYVILEEHADGSGTVPPSSSCVGRVTTAGEGACPLTCASAYVRQPPAGEGITARVRLTDPVEGSGGCRVWVLVVRDAGRAGHVFSPAELLSAAESAEAAAFFGPSVSAADAGVSSSRPRRAGPEGVSSSKTDAIAFEDIAAAAGLNESHWPSGPSTAPNCRWGQWDEESMTWDRGGFCMIDLFPGGAAVADFTGDGINDVYLSRMGARDQLLVGRCGAEGGGCVFDDEAEARGIDPGPRHHDSAGAAFLDADGDGHLDLYVATVGSAAFRLYMNDGNGSFRDEAAARGAANVKRHAVLDPRALKVGLDALVGADVTVRRVVVAHLHSSAAVRRLRRHMHDLTTAIPEHEGLWRAAGEAFRGAYGPLLAWPHDDAARTGVPPTGLPPAAELLGGAGTAAAAEGGVGVSWWLDDRAGAAEAALLALPEEHEVSDVLGAAVEAGRLRAAASLHGRGVRAFLSQQRPDAHALTAAELRDVEAEALADRARTRAELEQLSGLLHATMAAHVGSHRSSMVRNRGRRRRPGSGPSEPEARRRSRLVDLLARTAAADVLVSARTEQLTRVRAALHDTTALLTTGLSVYVTDVNLDGFADIYTTDWHPAASMAAAEETDAVSRSVRSNVHQRRQGRGGGGGADWGAGFPQSASHSRLLLNEGLAGRPGHFVDATQGLGVRLRPPVAALADFGDPTSLGRHGIDASLSEAGVAPGGAEAATDVAETLAARALEALEASAASGIPNAGASATPPPPPGSAAPSGLAAGEGSVHAYERARAMARAFPEGRANDTARHLAAAAGTYVGPQLSAARMRELARSGLATVQGGGGRRSTAAELAAELRQAGGRAASEDGDDDDEDEEDEDEDAEWSGVGDEEEDDAAPGWRGGAPWEGEDEAGAGNPVLAVLTKLSAPFPHVGAFEMASTWADLDLDGWPDGVVSGDFGTSQVLWNNGDGTFTRGFLDLLEDPEDNSMGCTIADVNGDGLPDIAFSSVIVDERRIAGLMGNYRSGGFLLRFRGNHLFLNLGNRRFVDVTDSAGVRHAGWGWGASFLDADSDGTPELFVGNGIDDPETTDDEFATNEPNRLFVAAASRPTLPVGAVAGRQASLRVARDALAALRRGIRGQSPDDPVTPALPGVPALHSSIVHEDGRHRATSPVRFAERAEPAGLADRRDARGVVVLDQDGDGRLDLLVVNHARTPSLYRNVGSVPNGYVRVLARRRAVEVVLAEGSAGAESLSPGQEARAESLAAGRRLPAAELQSRGCAPAAGRAFVCAGAGTVPAPTARVRVQPSEEDERWAAVGAAASAAAFQGQSEEPVHVGLGPTITPGSRLYRVDVDFPSANSTTTVYEAEACASLTVIADVGATVGAAAARLRWSLLRGDGDGDGVVARLWGPAEARAGRSTVHAVVPP